MDAKSVSLSELILSIKAQLTNAFALPIWVVAEIGELNENYSGHCYLDLVEKDEQSEKLLAKSRATIWANSYRMIKPYFETTTRETLKAGLKVLIKVTVEFHEFYGFSLNVIDIDPGYTVGDLALKRNLIIEKLINEGVFEMNKNTELPLVPQKIAVISSETAAGFDDFCNQLQNNAAGFKFNTKLYPAIMQGNNAAESIVNAFNSIFDTIDDFDAVVLIRGGGSKIDLSCFDNYDLAYIITQFPIPIITGIGHERDESIADLVAHTNLKTPTAVAEFFIDNCQEFNERLNDAQHTLSYLLENYISDKQSELKELSLGLSYATKLGFENQLNNLEFKQEQINRGVVNYVKNKEQKLEAYSNKLSIVAKSTALQASIRFQNYEQRISAWTKNIIDTQNQKLYHFESKLSLLDPNKILDRGFAIVTSKDKLVTNSEQLKVGEELNITLSKGSVETRIEKLND